jgi:hypothetical protein
MKTSRLDEVALTRDKGFSLGFCEIAILADLIL